MTYIHYGSKKILLKGCDCKDENILPVAKLSLSDVDKISEFLKSEEGEDIEICIAPKGKSLCEVFRCINAAGGLIKNEKNEYLFIFRRNKWDLPKGKVDDGETSEQAAIREVKEECGLKKIKTDRSVCHTFHIYPLKNNFVLKSTHWFLMTAHSGQQLKPQTEEDITETTWLQPAKIKKIYNNTFPSVLEVLANI